MNSWKLKISKDLPKKYPFINCWTKLNLRQKNLLKVYWSAERRNWVLYKNSSSQFSIINSVESFIQTALPESVKADWFRNCTPTFRKTNSIGSICRVDTYSQFLGSSGKRFLEWLALWASGCQKQIWKYHLCSEEFHQTHFFKKTCYFGIWRCSQYRFW